MQVRKISASCSMKLFYTFTALLLAPLAVYTQPAPSLAKTVKAGFGSSPFMPGRTA
jgi:hypothetical protein